MGRPRPKSNPRPDGKDLVKSLEDVMRAAPQSEGMTMREIAQMVGRDDGWCRVRLVKLMEAGKLEAGRSARPALDGTMRLVPVYRLRT